MVRLLISKLINPFVDHLFIPLCRYTKEEHLLKQAKDLIQEGFFHSTTFQPNSMLICTWKDVHAFFDKDDKVNIIIRKIFSYYLFQ
jgi:hypothetical protein